MNFTAEELFSLEHTVAAPLFKDVKYVWEVLPKIKDFIIQYGKTLSPDKYDNIGENVWVAKTATVAPTAVITGPCIIGENTQVRHCAFIRGSALIGDNCVVGNSTEIKNVIISDNVQVPHYNYVGDTILGYRSHMGAGSITSNVKSDRQLVVVHTESGNIETGMKKFGAMIGDFVEIGCGSVINPGTIIGKHTTVYPLSSVRGVIPENSIYKNKNEIVTKE